jgi:hypothetical protein
MSIEQLPPCREVSLGLAESLTATATTAPSWLLVEHPGPWPAKAPRGVRWPEGLAEQLRAATDRVGVRTNLIRRPTGPPRGGAGTEVLLVHTGPSAPRLQQLRLPDPRAVLDLDLAALAHGELPDAERSPGVFLVCTHGRRDSCCALTGRPLAAALAERFGADTWESTHLGGHRFAPTLACFPHGLMYGRLSVAQSLEVAHAYRAGYILAEGFRGRSCWTAPVQAAEAWLREHLDNWEIDAVLPVAERSVGERVEVELAVPDGRSWRMRVAAARVDPPRRVSCRETVGESPLAYHVVAAEPVVHPHK